MRKHRDYSSREQARKRSVDMLKARSKRWKPAGVAADGFVYPEGDWPGESVGRGRACRPEIGIATHAVEVKLGAGRLAGRFLVEDPSGEDVADDEIEKPLERGDDSPTKPRRRR